MPWFCPGEHEGEVKHTANTERNEQISKEGHPFIASYPESQLVVGQLKKYGGVDWAWLMQRRKDTGTERYSQSAKSRGQGFP